MQIVAFYTINICATESIHSCTTRMSESTEFGRWLSNPSSGEEVVITGVSGLLPSSRNVQEFKENLFNRVDMVTDDGRRWNINHPEMPRRGAKIPDIEKFDAGYFGVHHKQAEIMDPAMRKFFEAAMEAILDAGLNPSELEGSKTGVFVGTSYGEACNESVICVKEDQKYTLTGYLRSMLAHRLSYYLKLKGPSYTTDTACSSSFVAFENAFKSVRMGQCDNAIVGGVNLIAHPGIMRQFFRLGVLSREGICRVFDEKAEGYVRADSVVCVLLQKAKNSRRVYAQVIHSKINDDGFKPFGITFPSAEMQEILMTEVLQESGHNPSDIDYIESHGTGTPVGDPEEVKAIDLAVAKKRSKPLLVGSVKCSIGHSESSSGLASLIKVILALETGYVPPNIHLEKVKTGMEGFEQGRMIPVTETTKLNKEEAVIGINNFGFGGNNCHVLVKRFGKSKSKKEFEEDDCPLLVCVSGRTKETVSNLIQNLNTRSVDREYVAMLHKIFEKNAKLDQYRGYTILSTNEDVKSHVKFFSQHQQPFYVFFGHFQNSYKTVEEDLMKFSCFKDSIIKTNTVFDKYATKNGAGRNDDILKAFATQIGIVDVLKTISLEPTAVYGDSFGKLATAYFYGDLNLEDAVKVMCKRVENEVVFSFETMFLDLEREYSAIDDSLPKQKKCLLLNVSDNSVQSNEIFLSENGNSTFLETIGRLYEEGHDPQLCNLYSKVQFPVSRNTPMISPLIEWHHQKEWYTYNYENSLLKETIQEVHNIFPSIFENHKYLEGHVIDGRMLLPAIEYLNLVWDTFSGHQKIHPVVFENCKFVRALTLPKQAELKLLVSIQKGSGYFEVVEKDSVVVSGRVFAPADINDYETDLPEIPFEEGDRSEMLDQDEIYRELYLRGYNYSGFFKGIVKCNVDASVGFVIWENFWTTFIDKMMQLKILQIDTRQLYVPVSIERIVINPQKHSVSAKHKGQPLFPVYSYKEADIIKSKGVEVSGIKAISISRRKPLLNPVLEKHIFVPNFAQLSLAESVRVNTQIILENSLEINFKAVEILDDSEMILPLVRDALDDVPLITPNLTLSTKKSLEEIPGLKIEDYALTATSNLLLVIATKVLERPTVLETILTALNEKGYVLTREELKTIPEDPKIEILTEHVIDNEKLILFRKMSSPAVTKFVKVSSSNFDWLSRLQEILKSKENVVIYSQNGETEGVLGLVNCIRRESRGSQISCFFIIDEAPEFCPDDSFYANQLRKRLALNIYKNGKWGTYRHLLLDDTKEVSGQHFYVNTLRRGDLSSLKWVEGSLTSDTKTENNNVLVFPHYCAINFKDVMVASGRVNIDAFQVNRLQQESMIGFEFSGVDIKGRRVVGMTTNESMGTIIVAKEFLWEIPEEWSLKDAGTVIAVYCTVLYALLWTVKIKPGLSILIHSATGGIGLAALNVCLYFGLDIYVTVGTQEKREFLRQHYPQIPESHIGNSRDTSFEEMIKKETNGRGVDIVLNSLSEEKLRASVRCMAYGGDFLEIGKFDMGVDSSFNLLLLEKNVSYYGVMLDRVFVKRNDITKAWLLNAIHEGIKSGYVKPLPSTVFKKDEVEKAFRYMMTGNHIGKVLIQVRDEEDERIFRGFPRFCCQRDKTYIIVGGLGGFGLELADWLYLRGAKKIVLVSRFGIKSGYQKQRLRIWESSGVTVKICTEDVTTKQGCTDLINEATNLGPVDAIFNLAVVLKDALFGNQTQETFRASFAPKAQATIYLDEVTRECCPELRYFVIFSSVSCGRGNPGQTNYGMANSVMERVCEKRKRDGFPGLAIQWGAIGDVGLVAKMQKENKELVIGGTLQQKISSCLEVLDKLLKQDDPVVSSMVVAEKNTKNYGSGSAVDAVANILGIKDIRSVGLHTSLPELGMDSMMGTEAIQVLERDFEIYLTAKDVRNMTFAKLMEIEAAKKDNVQTVSKTETSINMFLLCIPCSTMGYLPIIKLPSGVKDDEIAPKVFILPGIEGIFEPLEPLAASLKAHVFGICYRFENCEDSVEECAKNVLTHVVDLISTEDKFQVIAYSFGTVIATELVAQLESKGYSGNYVAIDGSPELLKALTKEYLPVATDEEFQTLLLFKLMEVSLPTDFMSLKKDEFAKCQTFDDRIDFACSLIPPNVPKKKGLDKQGVMVLYKRLKYAKDFKFGYDKIKSPVYLFKAKYPIVEFDNDYKFSEICEKAPLVTTVDGNHTSILNETQLTENLNRLITL